MAALDSMMKLMGVNPDDIKKQVEDAGLKMKETIDHFNARIDVVDKKCDRIIELLTATQEKELNHDKS